MLPILVKIGPLTIHTYGFLMAVGVALALWFIYRQAKAAGLDADRIMDASFYTIIVSLIGAKLILFIGNISFYAKYPKELLSLAQSGGVFQGGLTFGTIFALWYFHRRKIPTWKTADIIAPALAMGHGFGRIGCFSAGCCYGRASTAPWAATFTDKYASQLTGIPLDSPLHPVQLYEAGLNFLNFVVLYLILKRKKFDGQVFGFYIINYSVIRFFTEYFRGDHADQTYFLRGASALTSLSYPQLYCLLGLIAGAVFCVVMKRRRVAHS
ncbi:MAG TPA: prolipoprotein diacylglyceryl transferase [Candidatus Aminicenantes bacterium]|nr:prolipoprotein diacylglyceryl transferase [Candidatus Aminicenantes bacterium]HRY65550.1 prolipoprotein diacylglyceryl transferase [Candidatus Aminicenantes bacterium]HRZ72562.1 prolipoprotein diacylglyceryl transferase [Candidatus Aminicenantes bacterium]